MPGLSAPVAGEEDGTGSWLYDVGFFNPASNTAKVSMLRLANPNDQAAQVVIAAQDDRGRDAPRGEVDVRLAAQGATTLTAPELEDGASGFTGRLGDGAGKWRLTVTADRPLLVMSLLHATRTGHLNQSLSHRHRTGTARRRPLTASQSHHGDNHDPLLAMRSPSTVSDRAVISRFPIARSRAHDGTRPQR